MGAPAETTMLPNVRQVSCPINRIVTTPDDQHDVHVDDHHDDQVEYVEHCYQDGYHTKCENRAVGMPRKVRVLSALRVSSVSGESIICNESIFCIW